MPALPAAERARLARESLQHTGQMLMETPAAWLGNKRRILGWIREVAGEDILFDAIEANDGVIVILPHMGNWELINVYLSEHDRHDEFVGLYAPPNQDYLKKLMSEVRSRFGNEMVPTTVKGIARLFRRLRQGKLVVVLPDQVPASGEFAPFFGVEALTDVLILRMLRKNPGARVLCCTIERLPRAEGFRIIFESAHPDIHAGDDAAALAGMNKTVEASIRHAPAQYQWEYKRFKERPPGELRVYNYSNDPWTHH